MGTKKGDVTASKPESSNQTSPKGGATILGIADAVEEELEELIKSANNDDTLTWQASCNIQSRNWPVRAGNFGTVEAGRAALSDKA